MNIAEILALINQGATSSDAIIQAAVKPPGSPPPAPAPGGGGGPPPLPPPNAGSVAAVPGGPPGGGPPGIVGPDVPPPPKPPGVPTGAETPVTSPAPPPAVPQSMQSPPDLANMYLELMKKNQNAQALDSGLTLVAAGFAQPANRANLISLAGQQATKSGISMTDIIAAQKAQAEAAEKAAKIKMLPGIMKKYGMDQATVDYLNAEGTLDDVIKQLEMGKTRVEERADGSKVLIDARSGEVIKEIGGPKARPTRTQKLDDGRTVTIYEDTGEIVKDIGGAKPPEPRKTRTQQLQDGRTVTIYEDTGEIVKDIGGAKVEPRKTRTQKLDDGRTVTIYEDTGEIVKDIGGAKPEERKTEIKTRNDGSSYLVDMKTGEVIKEMDAARKPGDVITVDRENWEIHKKDAMERGETPMSFAEFKKQGSGGVNVYTGDNGVKLQAPPTGYEYERNPDGTVKMNAQGRPTLYAIEGGKPATEKTDAEKKAEKERVEELGKVETTRRNEFLKNHAAHEAAREAIRIGDANPNMAAGSYSTIIPDWANQSRANLKSKLITLDAQQTLKQLAAMRSDPANKTGGALGQVSDFENRMLASIEGSLHQTQDWPQLRKALIRRQAMLDVFATQNFAQDSAQFQSSLDRRIQELETEYGKKKDSRFDVRPKE